MRSWGMVRALSLAIVAPLAGCSGDCEDEIAAGERFLSAPENLTCKSAADCVVVETGCHTFAGGFCSQSYLSRTAANSAQWAGIKADLDDCEGDCAVCDGALGPPQCVNERCDGRQ